MADAANIVVSTVQFAADRQVAVTYETVLMAFGQRDNFLFRQGAAAVGRGSGR